MRIGLIDVDGHNFPNLPLMKLSAWHKRQGDTVEWYEPLLHGCPNDPLDKVYMSKVFSFTPDYPYYVNAKEVHKGGSGYCIRLVDGEEIYDKKKDSELPPEIETVYPDYSIYYDRIPEVRDTAYGFLTRGCPYGYEINNPCKKNTHDYCHVSMKEGFCSHKVADLDTFWRGQKNIVLLDPNITACRDWRPLFQQLADSGAWVDFSQGLDIHLMDREKTEMIRRMKIKQIHFAWDRYEDKEEIVPKFKMFAELTGWDFRKMAVYVLCNFDTTFEQDLERVYILRDLGFNPYVMLYNKDSIPQGHKIRQLQRWVNNRIIFRSCNRFEEFNHKDKKEGTT